jgi:2'-5' RNA ligase
MASNFDTTTALTFVMPNFTHKKINAIRSKYDKAYNRWMPHINFLFPFTSKQNFDSVQERLRLGLASNKVITRFEVGFSGIGYFKNSNGYTFHLNLDATTNMHFQNIFNVVRQAIPEVKYERDGFYPHLTLAQCADHTEFEEMKAMLDDWFEGWINEDYVIMFDAISFLYRSNETQDKMTVDRQVRI